LAVLACPLNQPHRACQISATDLGRLSGARPIRLIREPFDLCSSLLSVELGRAHSADVNRWQHE